MKKKILPNCLKGKYGYHLGESTSCNTSFVVFGAEKITVYTRVQVERVYKSNPIFEAKNTTFLEKV